MNIIIIYDYNCDDDVDNNFNFYYKVEWNKRKIR